MSVELRNIVARQKEEWDKKRQLSYIPRVQLPKASQALASELIKVFIGPRRAGKSVLAAIMLKDANAAYFNFDEPLVVASDFNTEELVPALQYSYGEKFDYLFLDEIQNLPDWQLLLNRLQREGHNVIISGSNANLLSGELITHLTGRYIKIEVLPFCFSEYLLARGEELSSLRIELVAEDFLRFGGYPELVMSSGLEPYSYLQTLFDGVVGKDIMGRFPIRKRGELIGVADWAMSNIAKELTFTGLTVDEERSGLPKSSKTVQKYLGYLEEAYLVKLVGRFDRKHRDRIKSPKKVFATDNGMALTIGFRQSPDKGRLLENLVHSELRKAGGLEDLRYFRSAQGGKEVDFVLRNGDSTTELIQACWDISDTKTRKRELAGLEAAIKETRCERAVIVTWQQEGEYEISGLQVHAVPFHKWALERLTV